jgi:YVTN family beta-propeller protein
MGRESGRAYAGFVLFMLAGCGAGAGPIGSPVVAPAPQAGVVPAASSAPGPSSLAGAPVPEHVIPSAGPAAVARGASLFGTDVIGLPTGVSLTPDAAPGATQLELDPHLPGASAFRAGNAVASALSPDGATLLVLTSGYNRVFDPETGQQEPAGSTEWVFIYDVTSGTPRETQVLPVPNAFGGVAFGPRGDRFYVGGGSDDVVHAFAREAGGGGVRWAPAGAAVKLGHLDAKGLGGLGDDESPYAAGLAVSPSGARVVVANHENDSVSVVEVATGAVSEIALRPGKGKAGGEFPAGVVLAGESRAFVTSQRDREVVEVNLDAKTEAQRIARRIAVGGQPTKLVLNRAGTTLYVANANSDSVSVIDVARGVVTATLATAAPPGSPALRLRGSNPNALSLSPDGSRLYVTNGGNNTLAVLDLASKRVVGLVPTGEYPTAVAVSADGAHLFVVYAKSAAGPNPLGPWSVPRAQRKPYTSGRGNQYALQLERAGLLALPTPDAPTLEKLTRQAVANNHWDAPVDDVPPVLRALRGKVKHVIYVIGENRTYDQILGDVSKANGAPRLTLWGEAITPNHHALARTFVTLDRFFDAGGVSGEGWQWSTSARTTDVAEKAIPVEYASRGHHSYDWEGANRNVNVSWPTLAQRKLANPATPDDVDLLPGSADVGAVDGPAEGGRGFLWDAVLASGQEVRNYGCFCDDSRYGLKKDDPAHVGPTRDAFATKTRVAFPTRASLHDRTDPYFRCFDQRVADFWREQEWAREFDGYVKSGKLPALEMVRLPHDHLGGFDSAEDGVTTPDTQIADNDEALGALVEKVSRSPYWKDTVIVALEDDAQNGSDHVDAHRSFVLLAGAHVKRGAKVSTPYATPSVLRTIELLLGVPPLGQQDAFAPPMAEVFDDANENGDTTPFAAQVPAVLRSTQLPLPAAPGARIDRPRGDATFWATVTRGQDFTRADALDETSFNRALACGLVGGAACVSSRD